MGANSEEISPQTASSETAPILFGKLCLSVNTQNCVCWSFRQYTPDDREASPVNYVLDQHGVDYRSPTEGQIFVLENGDSFATYADLTFKDPLITTVVLLDYGNNNGFPSDQAGAADQFVWGHKVRGLPLNWGLYSWMSMFLDKVPATLIRFETLSQPEKDGLTPQINDTMRRFRRMHRNQFDPNLG